MTTVINFKTDIKIKKRAQDLAKEFGLSLSDVLNVLLRNFIYKRELNLNLKEEDENNLNLLEKLKEIEKEGIVSPSFNNAKEAISWLNSSNKSYDN
ncbi:MAG: type II toxin-antitoxin system RelB/DinJ family antitoxin [bacterium]